MPYFYFDESIHPRGGFILGAYVFANRLVDLEVRIAYERSGLIHSADEFKSGARMANRPQLAGLREELRSILAFGCQMGIVVLPVGERSALGSHALLALTKFLHMNGLGAYEHEVYFDQGIFHGAEVGRALSETPGGLDHCSLHLEQDSKAVLGIQLADVAAYDCSTMLLETLGALRKEVLLKAEDSGYESDGRVNIGFELWGRYRYNFFNGGLRKPMTDLETLEDWEVDVLSHGVYIAESCDSRLRAAVVGRFGKMYLGCTH